MRKDRDGYILVIVSIAISGYGNRIVLWGAKNPVMLIFHPLDYFFSSLTSSLSKCSTLVKANNIIVTGCQRLFHFCYFAPETGETYF